MNHLSKRINRLSPSATLAMSQKSSDMQAQGIDVINLSVGEPDFNTPQHIKEEGIRAIQDNHTRYSPVPGYADLREAIVEKLRTENRLEYEKGEIVVSNGAKQCVCNAILSLVDEGDDVIIPAPYWVSYPQMVKLAGGNPVVVETTFEQGFKMTPEQLAAAITPRTRLLIVCSPCNPTGSVYTQAELEALAEVVVQHEGLYVISDEIYEHINYTGAHASIALAEGMQQRTILINGVSKAYAMTGWRIGFSASPLWLAQAMSKLQGQYTSGPGSISQQAALRAYQASQQCVEDMRQAFQLRRDLIVRLASDIPGLEVNRPDGAFYLFPRCCAFFGKTDGRQTIGSSTDLALYLLEQAHVATVAGDAFGSPDCLRLSYATSENNIRQAMTRIGEALARLK